MAKFIHVFPLSIYRDRIDLDVAYKRQLTDAILAMESQTHAQRAGEQSAWLGDTSGHEFLFQQPLFATMYEQIGQAVRRYTAELGLNNDLVDFYYQRSWATVTRTGERIHAHSHEQSNISFAYYLKKPPESGGLDFLTDSHPNELSPGIFSSDKEELWFIARSSLLTWNRIHLEPAEDEIVVFPSKTQHATTPSESDEPRISISADITMMLKESRGHETMMPHFSQWRRMP